MDYISDRHPTTRPGHWARKAGLATCVCVALMLPSLPAAAAASTNYATIHAHGHHPEKNQSAANEALVLAFSDELFNKADLEVIDQDLAPDFRQHNPTVADGRQGLRDLVVFLHGAFPQSHNTVERVIAQGDLVLLQSKSVPAPGSPALSIMDIYRVTGGKIVEHWDNLQSVPTTTVSGHDMFSTLSVPAGAAAGQPETTWSSQRVVAAYTAALQHDQTKAAAHFLAPRLLQHDPTLADGSAATTTYYRALFASAPHTTITVARVIAQGDLVAVHSHRQSTANDLGQSVVDIYRVEHGQIVEHWDGFQDVPATTSNSNTMF